ncbi:MAG: YhbY family RNA-binding protein [Candidatus Pacearchaeota archaeon]
MSKANLSCVQLGKQGITDNFISTLVSHFKSHNNVKVCVLKSAHERDKEKVKKYSEEILERLGNKFTARVIGFTINVKKWRKAMR